jgi:LmbE family N-acetylglucosaminyl deacetylase
MVGLARSVAWVAAIAVAAALVSATSASASGTDPSVVPAPRDTVVVYIPHADDDVLSIGVEIDQLVRAGKDVEVVYYTDGASTGVCAPDAHDVCRGDGSTSPKDYAGVPVADFIADRDAELISSVGKLGVTPEHVHLGVPGLKRARDGTVTSAYANTVLAYWVRQFPQATHLTMSWIDYHPDHGVMGRARRAGVEAGGLPADQALFSMARWYWQYDSSTDYPGMSDSISRQRDLLRSTYGYPTANILVTCSNQACLDDIHSAVQSYQLPTGIGFRSVPTFLDTVARDPRVLLHGVSAGRYPTRFSATSAHVESAATGPQVDLAGSLVLPSWGTFPASLDDPNALAQGLESRFVPAPFSGARISAEFSGRGLVTRPTTVTVASSGAFALTAAMPTTPSRLTLTYPGRTGLAPVQMLWHVSALDLRASSSLGVTALSPRAVRAQLGRPVTVTTVVADDTGPLRGAKVALAPVGVTGPAAVPTIGTTDARGRVVLVRRVDRAGSWRMTVIGGIGSTLPAAPAVLTIALQPSAVRLVGLGTLRRSARHNVAVGVRLVGVDHALPPVGLAGTRVRLWLSQAGGRERLVANVLVDTSGWVRTAFPSAGPGWLRYEVVGGAAAAANRNAGRVAVR